jgi:hypothetical protein
MDRGSSRLALESRCDPRRGSGCVEVGRVFWRQHDRRARTTKAGRAPEYQSGSGT